MDYNQYNQNVPPYPQPSFDFRETKPTYVEKGKILENKDLENSFVNAVFCDQASVPIFRALLNTSLAPDALNKASLSRTSRISISSRTPLCACRPAI